jgi:hypothetical protein
VSTKTNDRRRAHFERLTDARQPWRTRVGHGGDWVKAILADLPTHVRDQGFERLMSLVRDLERMGVES